MAQAGEPLTGEVEQPPRRRHQDVDCAGAQLLPLFGVVDASDQADDARPGVAGQIARVFFDLQGELPGWRQHEGASGPRRQRMRQRKLQLSGENRDEKRGGFAGARLRLPGDVVVGEAVRQHFALNGRALLETERVDCRHDGTRQREFVEADHVLDRGRCRVFTHAVSSPLRISMP